MPQTYEQAPHELLALLQEARENWHPVLTACDVSVAALLIAEIDEESGCVLPTLKHNQYPAAATIKATSLKERALGLADALLIVDRHWWETHRNRDERLALLDHELMHLDVRAEAGGVLAMTPDGNIDEPKRDDQRRPKLKMRQHDWMTGGFVDVARRHRSRAIEVQEVNLLQNSEGQWCWEWADADVLESVTASAPTLGRSVTLTREHGDALRAAVNATSPPPAE